jgi:glycosyltransferase involved in cell wall biosynthesis
VVTPYHREPEAYLDACFSSVRAQTYPVTHIVVADGFPSPFVAAAPGVRHVILPAEHADCGDAARAVGTTMALSEGHDAVTYLDADNWIDPDHVASLVALARAAAAPACVASRTLHRLDGSLLDPRGEPADGRDHVDTSCLFLTGPALRVALLWAFVPAHLHPIDDRIVWAALRALGVRIARRTTPTLHYRTAYRVHYEERGEPAPAGAKGHDNVLAALAAWNALSPAERERMFLPLGLRF